jgi:hypothetical protein
MATTASWDARDAAAMRGILDRQRAAFTAELPVTAATRKARLQRALAVVLDNKDRMVAALSEDFGHRSTEMSLVTDIMASVKPLKHAMKHLEGWMKPESRPLDFPMKLLGARARVEFQPKGVIGIISPWNFPVNLTFAPLAGVLAAGNRAIPRLKCTNCKKAFHSECINKWFKRAGATGAEKSAARAPPSVPRRPVHERAIARVMRAPHHAQGKSTFFPRRRWKRAANSALVTVKAWPRCRRPLERPSSWLCSSRVS